MLNIVETRRAGGQRRVSELSLGGDNPVDTASTPNLQAAFLARRYLMSDALARSVAELAFANGGRR